jgi:hypothetical protein
VRVRVCFVPQRGVNLVEGNVVINTQDNGIQFSSGVVVRNNIVVGAGYYGIFLSNNQNQQSGVYSNVQIVHNTVYNSGSSDLYLPVRAGPSIVIKPQSGLSNSTALATSGAERQPVRDRQQRVPVVDQRLRRADPDQHGVAQERLRHWLGSRRYASAILIARDRATLTRHATARASHNRCGCDRRVPGDDRSGDQRGCQQLLSLVDQRAQVGGQHGLLVTRDQGLQQHAEERHSAHRGCLRTPFPLSLRNV